jgi:hypothetical protein
MKRLLKTNLHVLPLFYIGILLFIFWNYFLPSVVYKFNIISPSLNVANIDFNAYYSAGKAYLQGLDPYNGTRYLYPPTFIPLYSLIARLSYNNARHLWVEIYTAFFLLATALGVYWIEPRKRLNFAFLTGLIAMVSFPLAYHVQMGQMDLIIASLCFSALVFYLLGHKNASAFCLAVAALAKVTPALFLVTFVIFFRDWKYLLRFAVSVAVIALLSGIFFPLNWYTMYVFEKLPGSTTGIVGLYNMTLLRFVAHMPVIPQALTALSTLFIAITAWFTGKHYTSEPLRMENGSRNVKKEFFACAFFLANGLIILMFAGKAWIMAYVWFILPLAVVLLYALDYGRFWWTAAMIVGAICLHSRLGQAKLLTVISLDGAIICLLCLLVMFFWPSLALIPDPVKEDVNEPAPAVTTP